MLVIRNKLGIYDISGRLSKAGLLLGIGAFCLGILLAAAGAWMDNFLFVENRGLSRDPG